MKKIFSLVLVTAVWSAFVCADMGGSAWGAEKTVAVSKSYNWKMTSFFPAGHNENRAHHQYIDALRQRTNGAVRVTIYESTLGAPNDHWDMLKSNAVQLAFLAEGYSVGFMPVGTLFNLPFEFTNLNDMYRIYGEWLKAGFLKEMTDNFKVLYFKPTMFQYLFLRNKKVTSLADVKGMKLRALSGLQGQTVAALGASGVSMSGGELYMALQTGVIDGTITGVDNAVDRKFHEVCRYGLKVPIYSGIWVTAINKETWNGLPKELQGLMEELGPEIASADLKRTIDAEETYWQTVSKAGMDVYALASDEQARWKKATEGIATKYVQDWAAKGHPTKEAMEMMRKMTVKK